MKKQYMKPDMVVVELKRRTALLVGSPMLSMPFSDDPDLIIDDPTEIH